MKAQTRSGGEGQAWMRIGIGIGASSPPCSIGGARRSTATPADRVVQRRSLADALAGLAFTITRDDPAEDPLATFELLLIVDPTNGRPLQVEVVIDHGTVRDITTPTVEWFTVFLHVGQVPRPPDRPA